MDFIGECNNHGLPESDFAAVWCGRCLREDCSRAIKGKSRFEARTSTWEERLFTQVRALPETDPRYEGITAKHFQETPGRALEVKGWDEPPVPQPVPEVLENSGTKAARCPTNRDEKAKEPPPAQVPAGDILGRVPNQAGRVLGSAPAGWTPNEIVIRPGGRVKVGGSGVDGK